MIRDERGAGTVLGIGLALAMVLLMALVLGLVQAAVAAAKAATAADLSALAAADTYRGLSEGDPCKRAAEIALQNGAQLLECTVHPDMSVRVAVAVSTTLPWPAHGQARAGPPGDDVRPGHL